MTATYTRKRITLTFLFAKGPDTELPPKEYETVTVEDLRVTAAIQVQGWNMMPGAQVRVYGLSMSLVNRLSTIGLMDLRVRRDKIRVEAGDDASGMGLVFQGTLGEAWVETDAMPDVGVTIVAWSGVDLAGIASIPLSYIGPIDVVTILAGLAKQAGLAFENNGVQGVMLPTSYFPGSLLEQIKAVIQHANIDGQVLESENTLVIFPKGGARNTKIPVISRATGMLAYPAFTQQGCALKMQYNPSIVYAGKVNVETDLQPAQGEWVVRKVVHVLESEKPNGAWFTECEAYRMGTVSVMDRN
jgi:hypothetical protein